MSIGVRSLGYSRAILRPSLALLSLIGVGGTAALALTMTSFSGTEIEIPPAAPVSAAPILDETPAVYGPMPASSVVVTADVPDLPKPDDAETQVAAGEPLLDVPSAEVRVIGGTGALVVDNPALVAQPQPAIGVASVALEPIQVPEIAEPITQTLIEMAPVAVYRPDERFNAANPEATAPPVPIGREKRPILQVTPAAVAAIAPARSVSLDPLLSDAADGTWPRRLDQVNARQNLVEFATAHNQSSNVFVMDVKIEGWGLDKIFSPPSNVGDE